MSRSNARQGFNLTFASLARATAIIVVALAVVAATPAMAQEGGVAVDQRPGAHTPDVAVAPVLSGNGSSLIVTRQPTCVQGRLVVDPEGRLGYAVPVIGPTVLRGSEDPGTSTSLEVIRLDGTAADTANTIVICSGAR